MKSQPSKRAQKDKEQSKKESGNPTLVKWNEMNRKQRREMMRKVQSEDLSCKRQTKLMFGCGCAVSVRSGIAVSRWSR